MRQRCDIEVKIANARAKKDGRSGPILLLCPSGVHRCGTFAVLDIVLDRLTTERKVLVFVSLHL